MGAVSRALKMKLSFKHYFFLMGENLPLLDSVLHGKNNICESYFHSIGPCDPVVAKEKDKTRSMAMANMMDGPGSAAMAQKEDEAHTRPRRLW